ncbi:sensor histidine kinase [uncultured Mitsuokella sp.]|uniref:cache domain-containing sensor histidine kinase n=1 Tax=uncultured Mitsuokella sp. TaxID=453120 RepID=UPI0025990063|nr:histidine kinase [uncultured Mitsuokella sp.]
MVNPFYKNLRLRTFAAVMLLNFFVILLISIFFQQRSLSFFEREFAATLYEQAKGSGQRVDNGWQSIYQATVHASFDARLQAMMQEDEVANSREIAERLRACKKENPLIDRISLYDPSTHLLIRSDEYQAVQQLDDRGDAWAACIVEQSGRTPLLARDLLGASPKKIYLYNKALRSSDGTFLAWLTVTCSERSLYYEYLAALDQGDRNLACLYTQEGSLLTGSFPGKEAALQQLANKIRENPDGQARLTVEGQDYQAVWLQLPFSRTVFCLLKSQSTLNEQVMQMQLLCILSALVVLLLSAVFLYWISLRLAGPVETLAETMQEAGRGHLDVRAPVHGQDEIAYLSQAFNNMLERMNDLIERLASEREQKKEAELKALQYQIRPHFIYNMLNAIRFAAMMQGARNIGKLLADFVELLRASTNRHGSFVPLSEEIKTLRHYTDLQEFRLMDTFEVTFDLQDEALTCIVPRMILQPLVENSILHGPSEEHPVCHIQVMARCEGGQLWLSVHDDGQGMTDSCMRALEQGEQTASERAHGGLSGIGVHNVVERLHLYYGEQASLRYRSDGHSFTEATLLLPVSRNLSGQEDGDRG